MEAQSIKLGDVVMLNSGGPEMTILRVDKPWPGFATCGRLDRGYSFSDLDLPVECLTFIRRAAGVEEVIMTGAERRPEYMTMACQNDEASPASQPDPQSKVEPWPGFQHALETTEQLINALDQATIYGLVYLDGNRQLIQILEQDADFKNAILEHYQDRVRQMNLAAYDRLKASTK